MELYVERGFEETTVAEIAKRAGLTERTFFRHFADKREVLFYGVDSMREIIVRAVQDAPEDATALDAVSAALAAVAAVIQENPEAARLRDAVVSANAELRERELMKLAEFAAVTAEALRARGVPEPAASLAAEAGIAVFKVARARWMSERGQPDLPEMLYESMADLRNVVADRLPGAPVPS